MVINCAIDGPSGAGKSTIAKGVAKRLGLVYVDTGALYRTVGLYALRCGADTTSADEVMPLLDGMSVELKYVNGEQRVLLNGEDVSDVIRTNEISMAASNVSAIPAVREFLLGLQRNIAASTSIVMDGRDIGTVILPQANVKIFMTASAEERAKRRYKELVERGQSISYEEVLNDINKRDYNDSHRDIAPLKKADDAYELDTTGMTIDEVVGKVCLIIEQKTSAGDMSAEQIEPAPKRRSLSKLHLFIYGVVRLGVRAYLRLICRLRYEGTENIPSSGSYIVASNHISWSDPVYVNAAVKNVSSYIAKESIFKHPLSFLLKVLHVFPIKRDQTDRDALSTAVRYLDKGYNLTIFPEGTRSKDGKLGKGKSGVAFISHAAKADILPAGITVKKEKGKRKSVTVRYGKIIPYTSLGITGMSASQLRHARDMVMSKIGELIDIE